DVTSPSLRPAWTFAHESVDRRAVTSPPYRLLSSEPSLLLRLPVAPIFSQSVTQSEPVPPAASELMSSKPGVNSYCTTSHASSPERPSLRTSRLSDTVEDR